MTGTQAHSRAWHTAAVDAQILGMLISQAMGQNCQSHLPGIAPPATFFFLEHSPKITFPIPLFDLPDQW